MNIRKSTINAIEVTNKLTRQAVLVNVGMYGYVYNATKGQFTKVGDLIDDLVSHGENLELKIKTEFDQKAPSFVKKTITFVNDLRADVRGIVGDVVEEVSEEIEEVADKTKKTASRVRNSATKKTSTKKPTAKTTRKKAA